MVNGLPFLSGRAEKNKAYSSYEAQREKGPFTEVPVKGSLLPACSIAHPRRDRVPGLQEQKPDACWSLLEAPCWQQAQADEKDLTLNRFPDFLLDGSEIQAKLSL